MIDWNLSKFVKSPPLIYTHRSINRQSPVTVSVFWHVRNCETRKTLFQTCFGWFWGEILKHLTHFCGWIGGALFLSPFWRLRRGIMMQHFSEIPTLSIWMESPDLKRCLPHSQFLSDSPDLSWNSDQFWKQEKNCLLIFSFFAIWV